MQKSSFISLDLPAQGQNERTANMQGEFPRLLRRDQSLPLKKINYAGCLQRLLVAAQPVFGLTYNKQTTIATTRSYIED